MRPVDRTLGGVFVSATRVLPLTLPGPEGGPLLRVVPTARRPPFGRVAALGAPRCTTRFLAPSHDKGVLGGGELVLAAGASVGVSEGTPLLRGRDLTLCSLSSLPPRPAPWG